MVSSIKKFFILFNIGGLAYYLIETVYKMLLYGTGSHWSMFLLGGLCFVLIGGVNNYLSWDMPIQKQMLLSACIITVLEFITGCVINIWLGWNVWNYSDLPFNILGQVCLPFFIIWFFLSLVGIVIDDFIRYKWFGEDKPYYTLR